MSSLHQYQEEEDRESQSRNGNNDDNDEIALENDEHDGNDNSSLFDEEFEENINVAIWTSKKYEKMFEQVEDDDGKLTNKIRCKICTRNYNITSRASITYVNLVLSSRTMKIKSLYFSKHYNLHGNDVLKLKDELHEAELDIVSRDGQPFSFIQKKGFRKMAQCLLQIGFTFIYQVNFYRYIQSENATFHCRRLVE